MGKINKIAVKGYKGVRYINSIGSDGKPEKVYYIRYKRSGKTFEDKVGRSRRDNITPAKANRIRTRRIEGELSNPEQREKQKAEQLLHSNRWTFDKLHELYQGHSMSDKSKYNDHLRYLKHIQPHFGTLEPSDLCPLDLDHIRIRLIKTLAPQTVKHILAQIKRIVNYGVKKAVCQPLQFYVELPKVDNARMDNLTPEQLTRLWEVLEQDQDRQVAHFIKMILYTGMRRGELFRLQWNDLDWRQNFIHIRNPKGGRSQTIPLGEACREMLLNHDRPYSESPFVFPGKEGAMRIDIKKAAKRIKEKADLPEDFRMIHGLRHVFASKLASSGKVDLYTIQRLLTHKDPRMTQRYAHLGDDILREGSNVMEKILNLKIDQKSN